MYAAALIGRFCLKGFRHARTRNGDVNGRSGWEEVKASTSRNRYLSTFGTSLPGLLRTTEYYRLQKHAHAGNGVLPARRSESERSTNGMHSKPRPLSDTQSKHNPRDPRKQTGTHCICARRLVVPTAQQQRIRSPNGPAVKKNGTRGVRKKTNVHSLALRKKKRQDEDSEQRRRKCNVEGRYLFCCCYNTYHVPKIHMLQAWRLRYQRLYLSAETHPAMLHVP